MKNQPILNRAIVDSAAIRSRSAPPRPKPQRRFSAGGGGREIRRKFLKKRGNIRDGHDAFPRCQNA